MEHLTNKPIKQILQKSPLIRDYISKTQDLEALTHIVRNYIEPELANHCRVANLSNNVLILSTTSPTWNHKLRFLVPELIKKLRRLPQYYGLKSIEIIQQPMEAEKTENKKQTLKPLRLSNKNAQQIKYIAEQIHSKSLAKALLRIVKYAFNAKS